MKNPFLDYPDTVYMLLMTHVASNLIMAWFWYGFITNQLEANHCILMAIHIICAVFMIVSLFFLKSSWAYIINCLLLVPSSFTVFALTGWLFFIGGFFALIVPCIAIINLYVFFSKKSRQYFGFVNKQY